MDGRTWCEINLDNLRSNFRKIKELTGVKILAGVKADAYGHGAVEVSRVLEEEGCDYLGVASVEEALELKENGIRIPILLLSPVTKEAAKVAIENGFQINLSDEDHLKIIKEIYAITNKRIHVHIEIDTGMRRTGIRDEMFDDFIEKVTKIPYITVEGIFSHFPSADVDPEFTLYQIDKFERIYQKYKIILKNTIFHLSNSAGIINFPNARYDMVRPGITIYGMYPHKSLIGKMNIKPVMSYKTRIVQIKNIKKGEGISYTHSFHAKDDMKIGVIGVGYADGYPWRLSNKGEVFIKGRKYRVVGNVCMDLTMIDISESNDIKVGDEVVLFDGENISVDEISDIAGTINYAIITGIGPRVPRLYIENGKTVKFTSRV